MDFDDRLAALVPTQSFHQLKLGNYLEYATEKKLFKGESLVVNAQSKDDLYFFYVQSGRAAMVFQQESGGEMQVTAWGAGNAFPAQYGSLAAIGRYKARIRAFENSILYAFTQRTMLELAKQDENLFFEYIHVYHMSIARLAHRLSIISNQSAMQRLVMWLQKLCSLKDPDDQGVTTIECNMTLAQMADYLSIHLTTCTKLVAALENEGVIRRSRSCIQIIDADQLERIGLEASPLA